MNNLREGIYVGSLVLWALGMCLLVTPHRIQYVTGVLSVITQLYFPAVVLYHVSVLLGMVHKASQTCNDEAIL